MKAQAKFKLAKDKIKMGLRLDLLNNATKKKKKLQVIKKKVQQVIVVNLIEPPRIWSTFSYRMLLAIRIKNKNRQIRKR